MFLLTNPVKSLSSNKGGIFQSNLTHSEFPQNVFLSLVMKRSSNGCTHKFIIPVVKLPLLWLSLFVYRAAFNEKRTNTGARSSHADDDRTTMRMAESEILADLNSVNRWVLPWHNFWLYPKELLPQKNEIKNAIFCGFRLAPAWRNPSLQNLKLL